ncbi:3-oxoacyl-[acyl-carrier-protein] reductase [Gordonia humi]|uniref:SDR family oxidoreductase n=1 Tax=Gordonia humi TaxID=686429 RepID=UPI00337F05B6
MTGGGRGIGAAVCERLASDGFAVAVNYARSADAAAGVVARIEENGGEARAFEADIADPAQAERLTVAVAESLGPPSVLINNAGMNSAAAARRQSPDEWDRIIGVNLSGAFYCSHFVLPHMYELGWGRIVFVSSPSGGRRPAPAVSAYSAAKAGLVGMTRSLAQEVARRGITVNAVMPGYVATDITASAGDAAVESLERSWPRIPAESVASTVAFLVGDDAADVSGEEIGVWRGGPVSI